MSETTKIMSSLQFPNTQQPYQVNDARIPADPGAYKYMATDGEGKWVAEDRLGYKTVEEVVVLPVQQFDLSSNGGNQYVATLDIEGLVEGKEYSVEFDGTEYATIAKKASMYDMDVVYIGSSVEESGGLTWDVPFCVVYVAEQGTAMLTTQKASASFGLSEITETIHPIPAEYLTGSELTDADNLKRLCVQNGVLVLMDNVMPVRIVENSDGTLSASATPEELFAAYAQGKTLTLQSANSFLFGLSSVFMGKGTPRLVFSGVDLYSASTPRYVVYELKGTMVTKTSYSMTAAE